VVSGGTATAPAIVLTHIEAAWWLGVVDFLLCTQLVREIYEQRESSRGRETGQRSNRAKGWLELKALSE